MTTEELAYLKGTLTLLTAEEIEVPITCAYGCVCGTHGQGVMFYRCVCGAAAQQERDEERNGFYDAVYIY